MSIFTQIELQKPRSNVFDLSHDRKYSGKMGPLYPCLVMDLVPGDQVTIKGSTMIRFAPLIAPIMHRVNLYTHYFFVPNRIIWPNWEDFITGGRLGTDTTVAPFIVETDPADGSLFDFMGVGQVANPSGDINISAIPFAAYQYIFKDYYQDQNLSGVAAVVEAGLLDGDNTNASWTNIRSRAWSKDYFTSALPWTQRGAEATIPLGTTAPIGFDLQGGDLIYRSDASTFPATGFPNLDVDAGVGNAVGPSVVDDGGGNYTEVTWDNHQSLYADLSSATAATIIDLRNAFKLQEWLEKNARGGARYTESILSHFGVKSSDARLQRPEFIGGMKTVVTISEVLQTSETLATPNTPQGTMAGHGLGVGSTGFLKYFAEEHGYIIGIQSVLPVPAYQQGLPRHLTRFDKFDYYWPSFAHIGEQAILNQELYLDGTDGENEEIFGYAPRYSEYKYIPSSVHGDFRSSLDFWHLGRIFSTRPALNNTFVTVVPDDATRIFAVQDGTDYLWIHHFNQIKARRRMPYFGNPRM